MCFSEEVSWLTLAASWTGCAVLGTSSSAPHWKAIAGFLAVVGGMQLWEALLWRNRRCTPTNVAVSSLGAVNNHIEPVVLYGLCRWLLRPRSASKQHLASAVIVAYVLVFGALTWEFLNRPMAEKCTREGPAGLVWKWNDYGSRSALYGLFLLAFLTTMYAYMPSGVDHVVAATMVATFTVSFVKYKHVGMTGSMWCFFAALLPWLFIVLKM